MYVSEETVKKRGCKFCTELSEMIVYSYYTGGCKKNIKKKVCKHETCPFGELDKAGTFNQYLKGFKKKYAKSVENC